MMLAMILVTHAIVGAALAQSAPGPLSALGLGFFSHFLLDALPHWDYKLTSYREGETPETTTMIYGPAFYFDLVKIGLDLLLALLLILLFFSSSPRALWLTLLGAAGGILPDFLQFAYFRLRWPILRRLQAFHQRVHTRIRLQSNYVLILIGIFSQILLVTITLYAAQY